MSVRTIPDGAAITNHFSAAFGVWVSEAGFTQISGLKDEVGMTDGPDKRGYMTGQKTKQTLTVHIPTHDPSSLLLQAWKQACASGKPGHRTTGVVTVMDIADAPIAVYELSDCLCIGFETGDLNIDGGEVAIDTYTISYSGLERIGP